MVRGEVEKKMVEGGEVEMRYFGGEDILENLVEFWKMEIRKKSWIWLVEKGKWKRNDKEKIFL